MNNIFAIIIRYRHILTNKYLNSIVSIFSFSFAIFIWTLSELEVDKKELEILKMSKEISELKSELNKRSASGDRRLFGINCANELIEHGSCLLEDEDNDLFRDIEAYEELESGNAWLTFTSGVAFLGRGNFLTVVENGELHSGVIGNSQTVSLFNVNTGFTPILSVYGSHVEIFREIDERIKMYSNHHVIQNIQPKEDLFVSVSTSGYWNTEFEDLAPRVFWECVYKIHVQRNEKNKGSLELSASLAAVLTDFPGKRPWCEGSEQD